MKFIGAENQNRRIDMNEIYKAYDRFIDAAKKFPRWSNLRRRPNNSIQGKLLKSIINEIAAIEDAIIEYKKDFFIVNYIGRENEIVDYLTNSQIGYIENIEDLQLHSPSLKVTNDINVFYKSPEYAYYQSGYLVFRNNVEEIEYSIKEFRYKYKAERFHVWNIFDEFAWWVGLTRFDGERNTSLVKRTINIFRDRPNSSENGIRNIIKNSLSSNGYIDDNEITFETPNIKNLNETREENLSLYEELALFNRDIARTKRWDIDYWDNAFRSIGTIPHIWNAKVNKYEDGVGYRNSLHVSTVKDLDIEEKTDIEVVGYKFSTEKIEEYVRKNNIREDINLTLTRYSDEIKPIEIQYKIIASDLVKLDNPESIFIEGFSSSFNETEYALSDFVESIENVKIERPNILEKKKYTLKFLPKENTMNIEKCNLKSDLGSKSLLVPKGNFDFNESGLFVNKSVLYNAERVEDLTNPKNLINYKFGGVSISDLSKSGSCSIDISKFSNKNQSLILDTTCELYKISDNPSYIKIIKGFTKNGDDFISSTAPAEIKIEFKGTSLEFDTSKLNLSDLSNAMLDIETFIDGELDATHSYYNVSANRLKTYSYQSVGLKDIKVVVKKTSLIPVKISNIRCSRFEIKVTTSDGYNLSPKSNKSITIPKSDTENRILFISIYSYGQTAPVIKSILIGAKLSPITSTYSIDIDATNLNNPELDIRSNCTVKLFDKNGTEITTFSPWLKYKNETQEIQGIFLDLHEFISIASSNPGIKYQTGKAYITIDPGETIDRIIIYGNRAVQQSRIALDKILSKKLNEEVFVNKNFKEFILMGESNERAVKATTFLCSPKKCNSYRIHGLPENIKSVFVISENENAEKIDRNINSAFEYVYFFDSNSSDHIAYNNETVVRNVTDNVSMIKNFSPFIPSNKRVLYQISEIAVKRDFNNVSVLFEDNKTWTGSSNKKICITIADEIINNNNVKNESLKLKNNFLLSNYIKLDDIYIIDSKEIELGRYIIENDKSEQFKIEYKEVEFIQTKNEDETMLLVEEDGFNKLLHSNIKTINKVKVNGRVINNYKLLSEEGIIVWTDPSLIGGTIEVTYTYKKPIALRIDNFHILYDKLNYTVEALERISDPDDYVVKNQVEGNIIVIDNSRFKEEPDIISSRCENPCYICEWNSNANTLTLKKIAEDNSVVIHNGYYYIDGKEYWLFSDIKEEDGKQHNFYKEYNVDKIGNTFFFYKESENYLPNSKMLCNTLNTHCILDFTYPTVIPNLSSLGHIGSCSSFSCWEAFNMNVELSDGGDGQSLLFSEKSRDGYAVLDVTKAIKSKKMLSCSYSGNVKLSLGREVKIADHSLSKSLFIEEIATLKKNKDKGYIDVSKLDNDYKYYLIVKGSGSLIEILITENEDILDDHVKAIDKLGFKIEEAYQPNVKYELDFSPTGMIFDGLELDKDWYLQAGTTIDWGVTKIKKYDVKSQTKNSMIENEDCLVSEKDGAWVETTPVKINFRKNVVSLFFKINDYINGNLKDFVVIAYGSNNGRDFTELGIYKNTNLVSLYNKKIYDYIKFRIEAIEGQIIKSLELFAQYKESSDSALKITENSGGTATTKVYDVGIKGKFKLFCVEYDVEDSLENLPGVRVQIRGGKTSEMSDIVKWTNWKNFEPNTIFDDYKLFQFRIIFLTGNRSKVRINKFVLEAV